MKTKKIIRAAIIGCGVVGVRRKYYIEKNKNYSLVAISDIKFKKKIISKKNINYYKFYTDLIKNENINAVFITLPNYLAAKVTNLCLKRNINVFCEKPPARSLKEIQAVKKIKNKKPNLVLKYGFNHRYHSSVKMAKKIIDSKKLGKILNFRCIYGKSKMITFESNDWRSKRKFSGGGILLDQGIHMLDLIKYFYGEFSEFYSCISNNYWNYNVEDNAFILLRDKTGVVAFLHSTATQWQHKFLMEITLQKGSIELGGILSGTKSYGSEKITILSKNDIKNKKKGKTYSFNADNSWKEEIKEFSDLILKKKNKKAEGNIVDAEKIMLTIDKIYRADKKWYNSFIKNN